MLKFTYPIQKKIQEKNVKSQNYQGLANLQKADKLPNPFKWFKGGKKKTKLQERECRRAEKEKYEIGTKLETAKAEATYSGEILKVVITCKGQSSILA